jgi:hypothetical protein
MYPFVFNNFFVVFDFVDTNGAGGRFCPANLLIPLGQNGHFVEFQPVVEVWPVVASCSMISAALLSATWSGHG